MNFRTLPKTIKKTQQIDNVKFIGIQDSLIIVYTSRTDMPQKMTEAWFLIDAKRRTEKVFITEIEYKNALISLGIEEVTLYDIKKIFGEFDRNQTLPAEWKGENLR